MTGPSQNQVLVVEDDPDSRLLLRKVLESAGYSVEEAADGKEAAGMLATGRFSPVILDLVILEASGLQLIQEAKRHNRGARVIAVSGHFSDLDL